MNLYRLLIYLFVSTYPYPYPYRITTPFTSMYAVPSKTCQAMAPVAVEAKNAVRLWLATVQCGLPKEEWNRTSRLACKVSRD